MGKPNQKRVRKSVEKKVSKKEVVEEVTKKPIKKKVEVTKKEETAWKGSAHSDESKKKMRIASQKRWAPIRRKKVLPKALKDLQKIYEALSSLE